MIKPTGIKNLAQSFSNFIYKYFENGSGKMILYTTMIAMGSSTVAQTLAILLNNKYSVSQKAFMVPQELTEGIMAICSLFIISKPLQHFSNKLTKSGKLITKDLKLYLEKHNLSQNCGKYDFDIEKSINDIIKNIQDNHKNLNISDARSEQIINSHKEILQKFYVHSDISSAIATTAGSVLTTAYISPFIRNLSASHYQPVNINLYKNISNKKQKNNINSITDYKTQNYNNSGLKI